MLSTMPFEKQKAIFAKLGEKAETGQLSKEDREKYEYSLKVARDNYSVMKYAEETAEAKGRAESEANGEARKSRQIALKMKQAGSDITFICEITGLSADEVNLLN